MNESQSAFLDGLKVSPVSGVTRCKINTPVGVTSAVQYKLTEGAYGPPPIISSPTMPIPVPSHPTTWSLRSVHQ